MHLPHVHITMVSLLVLHMKQELIDHLFHNNLIETALKAQNLLSWYNMKLRSPCMVNKRMLLLHFEEALCSTASVSSFLGLELAKEAMFSFFYDFII